MKIGVVIPYDLTEEGGVKRHGFGLAAALRRIGDEVDVIGPVRGRPQLGEHVHGFRGVVNVTSNGSANHIGLFTNPFEVWRLLRRRRYDVLHIHEPLTPSINYWAVWGAGRAARVGTFHAFSEHETPRSKRARRFWSTIAFRSYDRGIAVSPAAARFASMTFHKPLTTIPNGIDPELYATTGGTSAHAPLRLLFVGHWRDSRKGLPYLLDACRALRRRGLAWTLDVVGDGGGAPPSDLEGVRYLGPISSQAQLANVYAACDIFVAPSTGMESFGIILLEAMAAGRPIVCSDIEGYTHAAGPAARYVHAGSVDGLADAVAELAADPVARARFASLGRARVREFTWDRLALRVRDEYLAAIEARNGVEVASAHALPSAVDALMSSVNRAGAG